MMSGNSIRRCRMPSSASDGVWAKKPRGMARPMRAMAAPKRFRSSAVLMAGSLAPISSTP